MDQNEKLSRRRSKKHPLPGQLAVVTVRDGNYGRTVVLAERATGRFALAPDGTEFIADDLPGLWFVCAPDRKPLTVRGHGRIVRRVYACYHESELRAANGCAAQAA